MSDSSAAPQLAPPVTANVTPAEAPQAPVVVSQPSDAPVVETPVTESTAVTQTPPSGESETSPEQTERRNRAEERIQDLIAQRNAAKEYADFWKQKAMEMVPSAPPAPAAPKVPEVPPTLEQFGYDQAKWAQAMGQWTNAQVQVQTQRALQDDRQRQQQTNLIEDFNSRVETFKKDKSDFDLVMSNPKLPNLDKVAAAMVIASEEGPAMWYHLAKNPDEAVRIARLPPSQQALAIGRLENQLSKPAVQTVAAQTQPKKVEVALAQPVTQAEVVNPVSQAPDPLAPVPAGGVADIDMASVDVNTWMRIRAKETRSKRQLRR